MGEKMSDKNLITIKNLLIIRGKKEVLRVEKLSIQRGEVLAVVGPNGAGKSTLLLTLARLLEPNAGQMLFNGTPAQNTSDTAYRRKIALVMQDPLLFDLSVYKNVALGLGFRGASKSEIQEKVPLWLQRLGVADLAERRAKKAFWGRSTTRLVGSGVGFRARIIIIRRIFFCTRPTHTRKSFE